jgi:hypothetical protein
VDRETSYGVLYQNLSMIEWVRKGVEQVLGQTPSHIGYASRMATKRIV